MSTQCKPEITPRFEFRIFNDNLEEYFLKMKGLLSSSDDILERQSEEVYLISSKSERVNCKIRHNTIDIKMLLETQDGFEQWSPVFKSGFPVMGKVIENEVFPLMDIGLNLSENETFGFDEFIDLVQKTPSIIIARVRKHRFGFIINATICEFAMLIIDGIEKQTVAVESESIEKVKETIAHLEIEEFKNTNYPGAIKVALSG